MATLIVCIKRRSDFTHAEFSRYWGEVHAPLLLSCKEFTRHLRSYVQYRPHEEGSPVAAMFGHSAAYDGVAVLTFHDADALVAAFKEPKYLECVRPDEPRFIDLENCLPFVLEGTAIKADTAPR